MDLQSKQFDQPSLPGMENMREAEPHEQTHPQFLNRPDVFVHGRHTPDAQRQVSDLEPTDDDTFHAGTWNAAKERLNDLKVPWEGTKPRFFGGQVDPSKMRNSPLPSPGEPEIHQPDAGSTIANRTDKVRENLPKMRERFGRTPGGLSPGSKFRGQDEYTDWDVSGGGKYYRNEYEDPGSTSAVLPNDMPQIGVPNFKTHRQVVSDAIRTGVRVPSHVLSEHNLMGGDSGRSDATNDPNFVHQTYAGPEGEAMFHLGRSNGHRAWHTFDGKPL